MNFCRALCTLLVFLAIDVGCALGQVTPPISLAPGNLGQFVTYGPNPPGNILQPATGPAGGGLVFPTDPRIFIVDGVTYPYSQAGIQSALTAAGAAATGGNGAVVYLVPHTNYALGTGSGLTIPSGVCLASLDPYSDSTAITYNGTGAAITIDATGGNNVFPCLKSLYLFLGPSAGGSAALVWIKSAFGTGQAEFAYLSNLHFHGQSPAAGNANQVGILMTDSTGAPAGVSQNHFEDLFFEGGLSNALIDTTVNASCTASLTPWLCCTGAATGTCGNTGEANQWSQIFMTNHFWQTPWQDGSADSLFDIWESIQYNGTCNAGAPCTGFNETGSMNQVRIKCDNGSTTSFNCVNDTGAKNKFDISALTLPGVFPITDKVHSMPSPTIGAAGALDLDGVGTPSVSSGTLNAKSTSHYGKITLTAVSTTLTTGMTCPNVTIASVTDETTVTSAAKVSGATTTTILITAPGATDVVDYVAGCI